MIIKRKPVGCASGNYRILFILIKKFNSAEHGKSLVDAVYTLQHSHVIDHIAAAVFLILDYVAFGKIIFIYIVIYKWFSVFILLAVVLDTCVYGGGDESVYLVPVVINAGNHKSGILAVFIRSGKSLRDLIEFLCDNSGKRDYQSGHCIGDQFDFKKTI